VTESRCRVILFILLEPPLHTRVKQKTSSRTSVVTTGIVVSGLRHYTVELAEAVGCEVCQRSDLPAVANLAPDGLDEFQCMMSSQEAVMARRKMPKGKFGCQIAQIGTFSCLAYLF
jgi:hypothetical protein